MRGLLLACAALLLAACAPELDWREVAVPEAHFSVLLPGRAQRESRTLDTAAGALTMTLYASSLKQGTMGVAYTDYPARTLAAERGRAAVDAARDALLRNIGATAHSEQEVRIAGEPGREIYAEGRAGVLKARFVVAGDRLYEIAYVGTRGSVAMADIDLFLTSFKLLR